MQMNEFWLGDWQVDALSGELRHVTGTVRSLQPKVMAVLQALVAAGGRLVSRQQLIDTVWDGRACSDEPLNRCITELRSALGDDRATYIRTVPKRGYQLLVSARRIDVAERRPTRRWLSLFGVLPVLLPAILHWQASGSDAVTQGARVLVLPIVATDELQPFADALTDELIAALADQQGLLTISSTTAFTLRGHSESGAARAALVNADYFIEGNLYQVGDHLQVRLRMFLADGEVPLFSRVFEERLDDVGMIIGRIAPAVAGEVDESLAFQRSDLGVNTMDFASYRDYLVAKRKLKQGSGEDLVDALQRLERVLVLHPDIAAVHALLAEVLFRDRMINGNDQGKADRAREAARRALELDPDNPRALALQAGWATGLAERQRLLVQAATLDPGNVDIQRHLAGFLMDHDFHYEADQLMKNLRQRDPLNAEYANAYAWVQCAWGRWKECAIQLDEAEKLGFERVEFLRFELALALRDRQGATQALQAYFGPSRVVTPADLALLVDAHFDPLQIERARAAIRVIADRLSEFDRGYWTSFFHALIGDADASVNAIVDDPQPLWEGFVKSLLWLPSHASVRQSPAFRTLAEHLRLVPFWRETGPSVHCAIGGDADQLLVCR